MGNISLFLAFSAGLISFISPCVLPLVPAYVSFMTGVSVESLSGKSNKTHILYKSLVFVLGFTLVFILMGASVTALGSFFVRNKGIFNKIAGVFLIIFGIQSSGIYKFKFFSKEHKLLKFSRNKGLWGALVMGMAFATGWTPCVGPILSSILIYAGSMETISKGILLLASYSLGLGVPFVLVAMLIDKLSSKLTNISKSLKIISFICGIILIILGVLIFTNRMLLVSRYFNFT